MTKKILQLVVVLLIAAQGVMAQTVKIDSVTVDPGDIAVQVDMLNFTDVASMTLHIGFDPDLMDFTGIDDTQLTGTWLANAVGDDIIVTFTAPPPTGYTINGKAFDLLFKYKGGFSSELVFDTAICEINKTSLVKIVTTYDNGSVGQTAAVGTASMTDLTAEIGSTVTMPLNMAGAFSAVNSLTYFIEFNEFELSFEGIVDDELTGVIANANGGILEINWSGSTTDLSASHLLDMQFTYHGGNAQLEFIPGCEVADTSLVVYAVDYTNGEVIATAGTATLSLSSIAGDSAELVNVPIVAADFGGDSLGAITMVVSYDRSVMVYTGYSAQQLAGWVVTANSGGIINLAWSNNPGDVLADGNLVTLNFTFDTIAGESAVMFEPGSIVKDKNLATYPVSFNSGAIMPPAFTVSGLLKYANTGTVQPLSNSTVYLKSPVDSSIIDQTTTDANGNYEFTNVVDGSYFLDASSTKAWATITYVDIDDAIDIYDYWFSGGVAPVLVGVFYDAGDVDMDGDVDIDDAIDVYDRWTTDVKPPTWGAPDWVFERPAITVSGSNTSMDINGLCSGDVNASYDNIP